MGVSFGSIKIASTANPQPTSDLAAPLQSHVDQTCNVVQNSTQTLTCQVFAESCPDLKVQCENIATQSFDCDFSVAQSAASDIVSKENKAGMINALGLDGVVDPDGPNAATAIVNATTSKINQTCYSNQSTNQTLVGDIVCKASKDVSVTLMQVVDQNAACSMGVINGLVTEARKYAADQFNDTTNKKLRLVSIIGLAIAFLFIVGLMFLIMYA